MHPRWFPSRRGSTTGIFVDGTHEEGNANGNANARMPRRHRKMSRRRNASLGEPAACARARARYNTASRFPTMTAAATELPTRY